MVPDREASLGDIVGPLGYGVLDATCLPLWGGSLLSTALPGTHAHKTGMGGCPWTRPVSSLLPNPYVFSYPFPLLGAILVIGGLFSWGGRPHLVLESDSCWNFHLWPIPCAVSAEAGRGRTDSAPYWH